jgi:hypothetical protein
LVDAVGRLGDGKPDYRWAREQATAEQATAEQATAEQATAKAGGLL